MKACPACGSNIDDQTKCSVCGFVVEMHERIAEEVSKKEPGDASISIDLEKLRARIRNLSKAQLVEEPEEPSEPVKPEIEPEEAVIPDETEVSHIGEKEVIEEDVEGEYDEVGSEEFRPLDEEESIEEIELVFHEQAEVEVSERIGYKIRPEQTYAAKRKNRKGRAIAAVAVIILLVLFSWYYFFGWSDSTVIKPEIDGRFSEWDATTTYSSSVLSNDQNLNFLASGVLMEENSIFWYFETEGIIYQTTKQLTSYSLLIDSDGQQSSGFALDRYFGADLMVTISGSGGKSIEKTLSEFTSTDRFNWSAWTVVNSSLAFASVLNQAEVAFSVPSSTDFSPASARFVSCSYDGVSNPSITPFFALKPGVLVVTQSSLIPSSGEILISPGEEILRLTMKWYGQSHPIHSIDPIMTGIGMSGFLSVPESVLAANSDGYSLTVIVDSSEKLPGTKIGAELIPSCFDTDFPSVMISGSAAIGYVGEFPSGIAIDGSFVDWTDNISIDMDSNQVAKQGINISQFNSYLGMTDAFFFVRLNGSMMSGAIIPEAKKVEGYGGAIITTDLPPRVTGEDVLRVYIDTDPVNSTGAPSPTNLTSIRPDFMLEIGGRGGAVSHKILNKWSGTDWDPISSSGIVMELDENAVEIGIPIGLLGDMDGFDVLYEMLDWLGSSDFSLES